MKKYIMVLIGLLALVLSGCTKDQPNDEYTGLAKLDYQEVSDEDLYLSFESEGKIIRVSKARINERLKKALGLSVLNELSDTIILGNLTKDDTNYIDFVTIDMIAERFPNVVYKQDPTNLSEQEKEDLQSAFLEDPNYNTYKLKVAKEVYYRDKIINDGISDSTYESYYKTYYKKDYYGIILDFNSLEEANETLAQLGYRIENGKWLLNGNELLYEDIVRAFIKLNNVINKSLLNKELVEGEDFSFNDGDLELNGNDLLLANNKIYSYRHEVLKFFEDAPFYGEGNEFYTKNIQEYGSNIFTLAIKLGEKDPLPLEDVKEELQEIIVDSKVNDTNIDKEMYRLKSLKNIIIYDDDMQDSYEVSASGYGYTYNKTSLPSPTALGIVDNEFMLLSDFYQILNERYGAIVSVLEMNMQRLLHSSEFNKIVNYKDNLVLDKEAWLEIIDFINNDYNSYLSSPLISLGYVGYLKQVYGVNSALELRDKLLYEKVVNEYRKTTFNIKNASEDSDVWKMYLDEMTTMYENYFEATGYRLDISINNQFGYPIILDELSENQKQLIEEFYTKIIDYLGTDNNQYKDKLEALEKEYLKVPFSSLSEFSYLFEGIDLAKYKNNRIYIKFTNMTKFYKGNYSGVFDEAIEHLIENNLINNATLYSEDYIKSDSTYCVYVNTYANKPNTPTFEQVRAYAISSSAHGLDEVALKSVKTYFVPTNSELISSENVDKKLYKDLLDYNVNLNIDYFTLDDLKQALNDYINLK